MALVVVGITFSGIGFFVLQPTVIGVTPSEQATGVVLDSSVRIDFNKPVERKDISYSIYPDVLGEWSFENSLVSNHLYRTLVFTPAVGFEQNTRYEVRVKNITSSLGVSIPKDYSYSFKTRSFLSEVVKGADSPDLEIQNVKILSDKIKPKVTLLDIPIDLQDKKLSCEAASLKMALFGKDIYVTEDDIMKRVGYDLTPLKDGIWGDPNSAFVGDIDGKICVEGYGVHWGPIAKVANYWTDAEAFSLWDLEKLVKEIQFGNPVIVWGVVPDKVLRDFSWYTSDGDYIKTYKDTHVRLVVGFIGEASNPSMIILNDPTSGRLYWSTDKFMNNWKAFGYSGVVVR